MVLTQRKYAQDIIRPVHIENCKHVSTPLCYTEKLSKHNDVPLCKKDSFAYQSTVGALQYLTLTRPDLFFCCQEGVSVPCKTNLCSLGSCQTNLEVH
jgi:hypothetical protein